MTIVMTKVLLQKLAEIYLCIQESTEDFEARYMVKFLYRNSEEREKNLLV